MNAEELERRTGRPVSFGQEAIWHEQQLQGNGSNSGHFSVTLIGNVSEQFIERTCLTIVEQHQPLRSVIVLDQGALLQVVCSAKETFRYAVGNLACPTGQEAEVVRAWVRREYGTRTWDLSSEAPIRFHLLRHDSRRRTLVVVVHHVGFDGRSKFVFAREFSRVLTELLVLGDVAARSLDYPDGRPDEATCAALLVAAEEFWDRIGLDRIDPMNLPGTTRTGMGTGVALSTDRFDISLQDRDRLRQLAREAETSLFGSLLACVGMQLYGYGNRRPVLSITVDTSDAASADLIGLDVNVVPMVLDIRADDTFRSVLRSAGESLRQVKRFRHLPLQWVLRARGFGAGRRSPFSSVGVSYPRVPEGPPPVPGVETRWDFFAPNLGSTRDVTLQFRSESSGCYGRMDYSADTLDAGLVQAMVSHFKHVVRSVVDDPAREVASVDLLTGRERRLISSGWSEIAKAGADRPSLHGLFEQQVPRTPEAVALVAGECILTYRALDECAERFADRLRAVGACVDTVVGVAVPPSAELLVAVLGVLKSGAAFLPVDPTLPQERVRTMLGEGGVVAVVTTTNALDGLDLTDSIVVTADEAGRSEQGSQRNRIVDPDSLACLRYASTATTDPAAGVATPHGPLVHLVEWQAARSSVRAGGRTLQMASPSSRFFLQEIFSTWVAGGTLVIPPKQHQTETELWSLVRRSRINRLFLPFALLQRLAEHTAADPDLGDVREVVTPADQFRLTEEVAQWIRSGVRLDGQYARDETYVVAAQTLSAEGGNGGVTPLRQPVPGARLYILNPDLNLVPIGVAGEIFVGGEPVARGYQRRPDLTAARFLPDRFSPEPGARMVRTGDRARVCACGGIQLIGRVDDQRSVGASLVDLGAVEKALAAHPSVRESGVVQQDFADGTELVAYVIAKTNARLEPAPVRAFLKQRLLDHPLPERIIVVNELPRTPDGEVDRGRLPTPAETDVDVPKGWPAPLTPVQEIVLREWRDVLGFEDIGVEDNFFHLGGHSLLAAQMLSRLHEEFYVRLLLRDLVNNPTIAELSAAVERAMIAKLQAQDPSQAGFTSAQEGEG